MIPVILHIKVQDAYHNIQIYIEKERIEELCSFIEEANKGLQKIAIQW